MTGAVTRSPGPAGRHTRPLTAALLRLGTQPRVASDDDPATLLATTLDNQLRVLLEQQRQATDVEDPEAVHQMRVAIRRMRVALRVDADIIGPTGGTMRGELSWLGAELGRARDLDVLASRLARSAASLSLADQRGAAELLDVLHGSCRAIREDLANTLDGARYRSLLRALARQSRATPAQAAARVSADPVRLLDPPLRKLRRAATASGEKPTDARLHILRIRCKRLRYAAELAVRTADPHQHGPLHQLIGAAKDLQEILGDHHDTVIAEAWLREAVSAGPRSLSSQALLVAGRLLERELAHRAGYERAWPLAWQELDQRANALR